MKRIIAFLVFAFLAIAQDETASISGIAVDAVTGTLLGN